MMKFARSSVGGRHEKRKDNGQENDGKDRMAGGDGRLGRVRGAGRDVLPEAERQRHLAVYVRQPREILDELGGHRPRLRTGQRVGRRVLGGQRMGHRRLRRDRIPRKDAASWFRRRLPDRYAPLAAREVHRERRALARGTNLPELRRRDDARARQLPPRLSKQSSCRSRARFRATIPTLR